MDRVLKIVLTAASLFLGYLAAFGETFDSSITEATIINAEGPIRHVTLEVAASRKQRALGLMFRKRLSDGWGMIFIFPEPRFAKMWMKNTSLPLDMLFVDDGGIVQEIKQHLDANSETLIVSSEPTKYVIELSDGASAYLGIRAGSKIEASGVIGTGVWKRVK
ncbi:hypothetical protein GGE45_005905 [Rhizobium aethiopicum]|uniref:DUF192 domain-containing protein n=1 Tax=Rhizobium aethiopicum TaxID=1138170 RepID=UPI0016135692|nr:DUF192 domain-containing protein [Rhizobium aethiopicum]MBB4583531.1 hypothetical protein [Rhizobium aethiopicum]